MGVKRIVTDLATEDVVGLRDFYADVFELDVVMDFGWIATLSSGEATPVQISIASEGDRGRLCLIFRLKWMTWTGFCGG